MSICSKEHPGKVCPNILWWSHHLDMKEDYSDLAWMAYNYEWELFDSGDIEDNDDCMSEQIWAIKQRLGLGVQDEL